jgi:hypothetical protein
MHQEVTCPNCGNDTADIVVDMLYCYTCTWVETVSTESSAPKRVTDYYGSCGCEDFPCCGH